MIVDTPANRAALIQLTDDYRLDRAELQLQLDKVLDGTLITGEQDADDRYIDTTQETKGELQRWISERDALISEFDPRLTQVRAEVG
jgi:anti-sigma factor RsiW